MERRKHKARTTSAEAEREAVLSTLEQLGQTMDVMRLVLERLKTSVEHPSQPPSRETRTEPSGPSSAKRRRKLH